MKYKPLANSGIEVSTVGFGVWTVSSPWWGIKDRQFGIELLQRAFDLGINFFDTADNYGNGEGETILAEAFSGRRDKIVISTKFGYDFYHHERKGQQELPQDFSPQYVRFSLEESLRRLKTDWIDVYQMHNPRIETIRREDTFAELLKLKDEGKIRFIGASLGPAINERQQDEGVAAIREQRMDVLQIIYNLFERMIGEAVFPSAREMGTSIFVRVPHASGLLDGTVTKDTVFSENDHRFFRVKDPETKRKWQDEGLAKVESIHFLLESGRTLGQAAIQFILSEPSIATVFPNIYNRQLLEEFALATETLPLTTEESARLQELCATEFGGIIQAHV